MYVQHPLGSTFRHVDRHADRHDRHVDYLWLGFGWSWLQRVGLALEPAGPPLCGNEGKQCDYDVRYGPSRTEKMFLETTDMVEGGLEDDQ